MINGGIVKNTDVEMTSSSCRVSVPSDVEYYVDDNLVFSMGYYQFCGLLLDTFGVGVMSRDSDIFQSEYYTGRILSALQNSTRIDIDCTDGKWYCCIYRGLDCPWACASVAIDGCRYGAARQFAIALAALEYKCKISLEAKP